MKKRILMYGSFLCSMLVLENLDAMLEKILFDDYTRYGTVAKVAKEIAKRIDTASMRDPRFLPCLNTILRPHLTVTLEKWAVTTNFEGGTDQILDLIESLMGPGRTIPASLYGDRKSEEFSEIIYNVHKPFSYLKHLITTRVITNLKDISKASAHIILENLDLWKNLLGAANLIDSLKTNILDELNANFTLAPNLGRDPFAYVVLEICKAVSAYPVLTDLLYQVEMAPRKVEYPPATKKPRLPAFGPWAGREPSVGSAPMGPGPFPFPGGPGHRTGFNPDVLPGPRIGPAQVGLSPAPSGDPPPVYPPIGPGPCVGPTPIGPRSQPLPPFLYSNGPIPCGDSPQFGAPRPTNTTFPYSGGYRGTPASVHTGGQIRDEAERLAREEKEAPCATPGFNDLTVARKTFEDNYKFALTKSRPNSVADLTDAILHALIRSEYGTQSPAPLRAMIDGAKEGTTRWAIAHGANPAETWNEIFAAIISRIGGNSSYNAPPPFVSSLRQANTPEAGAGYPSSSYSDASDFSGVSSPSARLPSTPDRHAYRPEVGCDRPGITAFTGPTPSWGPSSDAAAPSRSKEPARLAAAKKLFADNWSKVAPIRPTSAYGFVAAVEGSLTLSNYWTKSPAEVVAMLDAARGKSEEWVSNRGNDAVKASIRAARVASGEPPTGDTGNTTYDFWRQVLVMLLKPTPAPVLETLIRKELDMESRY